MKRALAISAVIVMAVACGGGVGQDATTSSPPDETTTSSTTTTEAPAPTTTASTTTSSSTTSTSEPDTTTTTAASSGPAGGGYTYEEPGGYSAPTPTTSAPQADSGQAAATITIADFDFGDPVTIAVGESVEVVNNDSADHTFTSDEGVFDSNTIASGDTFSFTFDQPGEYAFFCKIHPNMQGTLTVEG